MSAESNVIVGLDIGTTKVCAIVGKRNEHGKIEVLGMGKAESLGVIRGEVRNIEKTVKAINEAVEKAKQSLLKSNIILEIGNVHVGIAGQHIKSLKHRNSISLGKNDEEINKEDVARLIKDTYKLALAPGDEIIHVLPQEYTVDDIGDVVDPIGMSGVRLSSNFHIITGNVDAIKNIYKSVDRANLEVSDLILEPLSSSEAVLTSEELEAGVCLVDIGGGTTDIAIFKNGLIRHTAVIPFGGNIITKDVEEGCNVLKNQAEALKVKFGSALADENKENEIVCIPSFHGRPPKEVSVKNLAMVIQARVEEIFESVLYEIKSSGLEKKLNAGIVITGGGSQLKHLDKLVEYVTSLDTRIGYANEHLGKTAVEEIKSPIYATGVGLMLKGFKSLEESEKINAISDASERKKEMEAIKQGNLLSRWFDKGKKWLYDDEDLNDF
ncbi:MAG: cell division protein FtsA [Bacteroidia bacterium]|nr:cell division protein FtsA [Bacteroidia bacterium]